MRPACTLPETGSPLPDDMSSLLQFDSLAGWPWAETVTTLFGFAWGAILGSFLNVVAYRLPRGESLVHHQSRCPRCEAAIRPADNVPVVGWLRLRGRCRDCGGPIAARYPLVEAGCGVMGMMLAWSELASGGQWLPRLAGGFPLGIDRVLRGEWELLVAWALHLAVVLSVVTWSLLDAEGWRPRSPLAWMSMLAVVAIVAGVPRVGPGGVLPSGAEWPGENLWMQSVTASLVGAAYGWILGQAGSGSGIRLGLPLLGSVLGWQALTVVAGVTAAAWRALAALGHAPQGTAGLVLAASGTLGLAFQAPLRAAVGAALGFAFPF